MKKIYTLILLFTITLFYSIPTQAYTLDGNDIPLVQTKNLYDQQLESGSTGSDTTKTWEQNKTSVSIRLRTIGTIAVLPNTTYTIKINNATQNSKTFEVNGIFEYGSNSLYLTQQVIANTQGTFTTSNNTNFIGINFRYSNNSSITASEIVNSQIQLERGSTATSYANYGFLTLNEIFRDSQLILNSNFNNGTSNFTLIGATGSVVGGIYSFTPTVFFARLLSDPFTIITNTYYSISNIRVSSANITLALFSGAATSTHPGNGEFRLVSTKETSSNNNQPVAVVEFKSSGFTLVEVDFVKSYNLTALGITHLTKDRLDTLYNQWENNNIFIEGYNEGFDVGYDEGFDLGYDEGFDDGVASDTSYAVGYALGLSEGEDMETGSSLLILIVALIGFVMMIFGFTTKRGIFNLLSVGAFVVLGTLLVEFVGFVIIAIGLVLINIYYAFFGEL